VVGSRPRTFRGALSGEKQKMSMTKNSSISAIKIIVIFTTLISGSYAVVIPAFAPTYKTYYILVIGIATSALLGGFIGYKALADEIPLIKIGFGLCYATVTAIFVLALSLFIILNTRGA
jgi:hypothetical protein